MDCNPFGQNCSGAGDWYTLYHYLPTVKMRVAPQADSSKQPEKDIYDLTFQ